jgi:DnaJ-class molecular chaperone
VLSDPSRRKEADEARALPGAGAGGSTPAGQGSWRRPTFDFTDLFGAGGRHRRRPRTVRPAPSGAWPARRGADVESSVMLPFDEAVEVSPCRCA